MNDNVEKLARLTKLKGIGEKSAGWMIEVGVDTPEKLKKVGAVDTYLRIKAIYPRQMTTCGLWALEGAINDVHYNALSKERKNELKLSAEKEKG